MSTATDTVLDPALHEHVDTGSTHIHGLMAELTLTDEPLRDHRSPLHHEQLLNLVVIEPCPAVEGVEHELGVVVDVTPAELRG